MRRRHRRGTVAWQVGAGLAVALAAALAPPAAAEYVEVRDFRVQVDGKPVGQVRLTITDRDDGVTVVQNQSSVQVKILLISYSYSYQGQEVWQGYRLLRLDGRCDDNHKQHAVQVAAAENGQGLRVRAGDEEERLAPAEAWTTSYWKLPDPRFFNQALPLIDADRGKVFPGQLQYVETEERTVAGRNVKLYHFRLTGGKRPLDLWFDVHHRLVRQEFVELRHQTVIELVNIRRGSSAEAQAPAGGQ